MDFPTSATRRWPSPKYTNGIIWHAHAIETVICSKMARDRDNNKKIAHNFKLTTNYLPPLNRSTD
jgi:hypothetical protein